MDVLPDLKNLKDLRLINRFFPLFSLFCTLVHLLGLGSSLKREVVDV